MVTDLQAANRALTMIGVEPLGALSDQSKAARIINSLITDVKDIVLAEFPWSFAARMEALAPSSAPPPPGTPKYTSMFAYPAAAVNVFRVFDDREDSISFSVAEVGGTAYIAAHSAKANVEYTVRINNLNLWRGDVAECLVTRLAHDAAYMLTANQNLSSSLFEKYAMQVQAAKANSVVEENRAQMDENHYVDVRR